jgi:hypothetical protein
MALALGGDCLADVAMLAAQPELFGPVASDPMVSRLVARLAADAPRALKARRDSRAATLTGHRKMPTCRSTKPPQPRSRNMQARPTPAVPR